MLNRSKFVVNVGEREFRQAVLEESMRTPVLVDFWAEWCGPCRSLGPVLEKLAAEFQGAFILAKVDTERAPALAQALQIRSIPLVVLFKDGRPVDRFVGALPEAEVRAFLQRHIQAVPSDKPQASAAERKLEAGQLDEAERLFRKALTENPADVSALAGLGQVSLRRGDLNGAEEWLSKVPAKADSTDALEKLRAQIALRREAAAYRVPSEEGLSELENAYRSAVVQADDGHYEEALAGLLEIVKRDRQFRDDGARRMMVQVFKVTGIRSPLAERFRAKLSSVLF